MKDLTQGSVMRHLLRMTLFLMGSMIFQSLYFLADMYWVGRLGKESVAAVGLAANVMLMVLAATQALGVGTTALISHAVGAQEQPEANRVFNQALLLSGLAAAAFLLLAFALKGPYCQWLAADRVVADLGNRYLVWFIPALALQFPLICMGAALRGAGLVKPTVAILTISVTLNLVFAPVLILGWLTGKPLGVTGAAMASLVALVIGAVLMLFYFVIWERYLRVSVRGWRPDVELWRKILAIGLPTGAELAILAVYLLLVYLLIRPFGAAAQGGFAIGARVNQSLVLPAVAVGMANAAIVGQNFGAHNWARVKQAFLASAMLASVMMLVVAIPSQLWPQSLIRPFSDQIDVIRTGGDYLRTISFTYLGTAIIFSSVSVFQGIGNTKPPFVSSLLRLFIFAVPVVFLAKRPSFRIAEVWYISAASIGFQAIANLWLLRRELRKREAIVPVPDLPQPVR